MLATESLCRKVDAAIPTPFLFESANQVIGAGTPGRVP